MPYVRASHFHPSYSKVTRSYRPHYWLPTNSIGGLNRPTLEESYAARERFLEEFPEYEVAEPECVLTHGSEHAGFLNQSRDPEVATALGSGRMVPTDKPKVAFYLVKNYTPRNDDEAQSDSSPELQDQDSSDFPFIDEKRLRFVLAFPPPRIPSLASATTHLTANTSSPSLKALRFPLPVTTSSSNGNSDSLYWRIGNKFLVQPKEILFFVALSSVFAYFFYLIIVV